MKRMLRRGRILPRCLRQRRRNISRSRPSSTNFPLRCRPCRSRSRTNRTGPSASKFSRDRWRGKEIEQSMAHKTNEGAGAGGREKKKKERGGGGGGGGGPPKWYEDYI